MCGIIVISAILGETMDYINIKDAIATILTKSAPVEDVLINVAPEDRDTLLRTLALTKNKLSKTLAHTDPDKSLIKYGENGQWELKTVVFNSAYPKSPAGKQPEPKDKNPDPRTGVNIDKNEDMRDDNSDNINVTTD